MPTSLGPILRRADLEGQHSETQRRSALHTVAVRKDGATVAQALMAVFVFTARSGCATSTEELLGVFY